MGGNRDENESLFPVIDPLQRPRAGEPDNLSDMAQVRIHPFTDGSDVWCRASCTLAVLRDWKVGKPGGMISGPIHIKIRNRAQR